MEIKLKLVSILSEESIIKDWPTTSAWSIWLIRLQPDYGVSWITYGNKKIPNIHSQEKIFSFQNVKAPYAPVAKSG